MTEQNGAAVVTSGWGKLNVRDLVQGAIMAGIGAVGSILLPIFESGELGFDINRMWKLALGTAAAHLIRKLLSGPTVVITNAPPQMMQAVKSGEATVKVTSPETTTTVIKQEENKTQ